MGEVKRWTAGLLVLLLLLVVLAAPVLALVHSHTHHHETLVEDCAICHTVEALTVQGKKVAAAAALLAAAVALVCHTIDRVKEGSVCETVPTLVLLKVKLSD